nr:hypothetical protein [Tanacetum cinerariifolium]
MHWLGGKPTSKPRVERLKREYHSIRQTSTETSTEFMQRFLRLAGFLGTAVGTEEEQAKNFQWGLRRSTLNHLMCMSYTDVAQVANVARNYEILHERDDEDTERPDNRQRSGDQHQPTSQQSSHRSHCHNNDRHGSDRRGGSDNHRSSNNSGRIPVMDVTKETRVISPTDLPILSSHRSHSQNNDRQGSDRRGGSDNHRSNNNNDNYSGRIPVMDVTKETWVISPTDLPILKDCRKNTTTSTSGQADKKPGVSGYVFAITEGQAANTSGTITGTVFIYGHAVFVLFDTGATHSVISSTFAS